MRFWGVFRLELAYQARRLATWFPVPVLIFFAFVQFSSQAARARSEEYFVGAPFVVASVAVIGLIAWLVIAAFVAGDAAARDVATRMDSLTYTTPVRKAEYLGGRFLAALVLNAVILLAVPAGALLGVYGPEVEADLRGPFLPAAYVTAYAFILLPGAFVGTAVQFSAAALGRSAVASYLSGIVLLIVTQVVSLLNLSRDLRGLLDPFGILTILRDDLTVGWTQVELNTRLVALDGGPLANRLLWTGVAVGLLVFTYRRFRFRHPTLNVWSRLTRRPDAHVTASPDVGTPRGAPVLVPPAPRSFGLATHVRQALAIAWPSFRVIARSRSGLIVAAAVTFLASLLVLDDYIRVELLPRTEHVLSSLTIPQPGPLPWLLIPLLIVLWAGELVWREREAGSHEIIDTAPVPEWVLLAGKFLGLCLVPVAFMTLFMVVGMVIQVARGYPDIEIGLYLQVLFGLQLADYAQLALFALAVHVVVNHKAVGQVVVLLVLLVMMIAYANEMWHDLLVPVFSPAWVYTDLLGFGPSLGPWVVFKLYWVSWVLLLAVVARLLWVRGQEVGLGARLRVARRRITRPTAATAGGVGAVALVTGGFIFYNTNVLNQYTTASERTEQRAEYERRYGRYESVPQPRLAGTNLQVEIYPARREVELRGTYLLVHDGTAPIDSIHLATAHGAATVGVEFDRPAALALADDVLCHRIYALAEPLPPGDSLRLAFEVNVALRDFSHRGLDPSISARSTFFTNQTWLPAIGYQWGREIANPNVRRQHDLPARPVVPTLDDADVSRSPTGGERITFEAVVGTSEDQVAVAPGLLRRTWAEGGRRYFHYAADATIGNEYAIASAAYAVHEARWNDVLIQIYHHPEHAANLDRMVASVRASLEYNTEHFGPSPHRYIRLIERPGRAFGLHAEDGTITYGESFSLLDPEDDPLSFDLMFATVAHEVGHGWGVPYARVEGAGLLSESFAWYAAFGAVEHAYGREHLRRLLSWMHEPLLIPPVRATVPLLRAANSYLNYRRGPFALYALREYIGEEAVNGAIRRFRDEYGSPSLPRATSRDLYRHLRAAAPDSLQYLLHDLFEANTWWDLGTARATAERRDDGTWEVVLDVRAGKVVVDTAGVETPVPVDDWVEIGLFAPAAEGEERGEALYLGMHRIRSAEQTITVTVPREPARAGIDPYQLLIEWDPDDNTVPVRVAR